MTYGNFWDRDVWTIILLGAVLFAGMLIANIIKRTVPFLRDSLMPASVMGGLILLLISTICKITSGEYLFNFDCFTAGGVLTGINKLEALTYHCLAIGFIAMSLRQAQAKLTRQRTIEIFNTGITTVSTYLMQALFGLVITIGAFYIIKDPPIKASGILLALGYGQGTGQALNYGSIYETQFGFFGGKSFGLTVAAMGFLSASLVGVVYLNKLKKKGLIKNIQAQAKPLKSSDIEAENEIPMSASVDKLTVQVATVFVIYAISAVVMKLLGNIAGEGLRATVYGFNFLIGTLVAILFKCAYRFLRKKKLIHREYINDFMMSRISGLAFDVMITAGIAAIQIDLIASYFWVLVVLGVTGAVITFVYLKIVCRELFPAYETEQFMAMYGMLTGTASTGIILLREVDEYFKTPVSENLVYQNLPAIVFGFPIMLLVSYAPTSDKATLITLGACAVLFVVMNAILFRSKLLKKKEK